MIDLFDLPKLTTMDMGPFSFRLTNTVVFDGMMMIG